MYENLQLISYTMVKKLKTLPLRSESRQRCPTLINSIQHSTGNLGRAIRQEKEIKDIQIRKEVKCPCFHTT